MVAFLRFRTGGGELPLSDNWIVANLENAFSTWNDKMTEIWQLLTTSPQSFKGGAIWGVISIFIAGAIYYPFFKVMEKQRLSGEEARIEGEVE